MNFNPTIQNRERSADGDEQKQEQEDTQGEKPRCEWHFSLISTILSSTNSSSTSGALSISDTLGATEFDPSGQLLATAGIARKIRIYNLSSLFPARTPNINNNINTSSSSSSSSSVVLDHSSACDYYLCTPAKLSSLRWKPNTGARVLGSGDYDGVVTEYDLERRVPIFERDEHGGRRIWSIDYSASSGATLGASGSDDGTMQVWDTRCGNLVGFARPSETRSPVCCVEFNPFIDKILALGCADRRAYAYDIRRMSGPVSVFKGHQRTVSYVRFLGEKAMVSAGTDGCLKLWELESARAIRTFKGHVNSRNFVGLSVWKRGGLIGCGSESGEVFVYDKRWGEPIWVCGLVDELRVAGTGSGEDGDGNKRFVGSVCWREVGEHECTLVAGGSDGVLQLFAGKRIINVD